MVCAIMWMSVAWAIETLRKLLSYCQWTNSKDLLCMTRWTAVWSRQMCPQPLNRQYSYRQQRNCRRRHHLQRQTGSSGGSCPSGFFRTGKILGEKLGRLVDKVPFSSLTNSGGIRRYRGYMAHHMGQNSSYGGLDGEALHSTSHGASRGGPDEGLEALKSLE